MTDASEKPAFLIVCGTATGKPMDPEYGKRATSIALQTGLKPIGGGEVGSPQFELLEGSLPEGTNFVAVEQFPSMEALKTFYYSEDYQAAIPFRESAVEMKFMAAVDGISEEELKARAEAAMKAAEQ